MPADIIGLIMHDFDAQPDWIAIHASAIALAALVREMNRGGDVAFAETLERFLKSR